MNHWDTDLISILISEPSDSATKGAPNLLHSIQNATKEGTSSSIPVLSDGKLS